MTAEVISPISEEQRARLATNWSNVLADVEKACHQVDRNPNEITIIGVTKYVDASMTAALIDQGCNHIGENRPQVLWSKAEAMQTSEPSSTSRSKRATQWHQIGQLQTNKVRRLLRHRPVIHSIDRAKLFDSVAHESNAAGIQTDCLLEINISGDEKKTGFLPQQIESSFGEFLHSASTRIRGLMGMAGLGTGPDESSQQFRRLRELRDRLQDKYQQPLPDLSMGMSGDFVQAIAEGATMVRIGSSLFRGLINRS